MVLTDLVDDAQFRAGLAVGVIALVVVLALALWAQRHDRSDRPHVPGRRHGLLPAAGLAVVAASVVGLDRPGSLLSGRLVAGLAFLVVGPFLTMLALAPHRAAARLAAVSAIPGAVLVARAAALENGIWWIPMLVVVSTVVGGALVADFDRANARAGLGPTLFAVATLAMYTTLPDTEQAAVLVGVALPLALLGWPVAHAAFGPGAYSTVGLVAWVAAVGGRGRPGAVIGAVACLGLMLTEPLVRRAWRGRARSPARPVSSRATLVILLQVLTVIGTARVAGLETSAGRAVAISSCVLAASALGLAAMLAPWRATAPPKPGSRPMRCHGPGSAP
jgi:hypothetical protein